MISIKQNSLKKFIFSQIVHLFYVWYVFVNTYIHTCTLHTCKRGYNEIGEIMYEYFKWTNKRCGHSEAACVCVLHETLQSAMQMQEQPEAREERGWFWEEREETARPTPHKGTTSLLFSTILLLSSLFPKKPLCYVITRLPWLPFLSLRAYHVWSVCWCKCMYCVMYCVATILSKKPTKQN